MKGSGFSIKTVLISSFILIAIIMTSFSLVQRYIWLNSHERDKITEDFMPVAESMGRIIEMTLNQRLTLLTQVSEEVIKAGMNPERMQSIVESVHFRNPDFKTFWIGDASGRAIAFSPRYDRDGRLNIGRDYSDREYYRRVRDEKRPVIGELIIGRVAGEAIIPLAVPIIREGEFKGFVFGALDPEAVRRIVRTIKVYGRGNLTVTDEKGKAIAMSNRPQLEKELKDLSSTEIFKKARQEKKGVAEYVSLADGKGKIGAFYSLENGWKIWASRDLGEMKSDIVESFYGALIIAIIGLVLVSGLGYFLSFQISRPIQRLKENSIALSSGRFEMSDGPRHYGGIISEIKDLNKTFFNMADELRSLYKGLEDKIRERTSQLEDANRELQTLLHELELRRQEAEVARQQAEAANRAKSDFLANMSHELRTPLNAIIGFSEILLDELFGKLNERQKEYINDIYQSGKHLLSLINDILDLSKVESGKAELELGTVSLSSLLKGSLTMVKERALKHNIRLSCDVAPEADIEVMVDERKMKQIIFNLLSNAVKFTPEGGAVNLTARMIKAHEAGLDALQPDENCIVITVEDTGIGIKPEDMEKLFKPFSQLESPYSKKYEGTGLGLALTKNLVELHKGRIWVESEFGKGSRFSFVIPVKQS